MKKNLLNLAALVLMAWVILPACTNNAAKDPALQAPVPAPTEMPAADAAAVQQAPADSTTAVRKNEGDKKAEKKEEEKDDDD